MLNEQRQTLFEEALEQFPYTELQTTGITQGTLEDDGFIEYGEEYTFTVGQLLDDELVAGGWIEYREDDGDITISAIFNIARNGDWKEGRILGEYEALQGWYDLDKKTWELAIDSI